jgi:hypothetical protein
MYASASAKCNSVRKPYANLSDTPVALASASKYFQMLSAPPAALINALRLCKSISHVLLKAPAVMEAHSGCYEI